MNEFQHLSQQLNYAFQNPLLLQQALTHRSFHYQHNERFEFLGDALLESIISAYIFHQFPELSEGELSRLRTKIVRGESLAQKAQFLQLGSLLRLGAGERKSGGWRRESLLADALEALIAAIYLDSDYQQCERCVLQLFADELQQLSSISLRKDAKTQLQEYLQQRGFPLPTYSIIAESGPEHNPVFEVKVEAEGKEAFGRANSRKKAEQQAAELLLPLFQSKKHKEKT